MTTTTDDVVPALAAIGRFHLLPLLPDQAALALAGPVALVDADVRLDAGTSASVARTLASVAPLLGPMLANVAPEVTLPRPPAPVTPHQTKAAQARPPVLRLAADGRIKIEQTGYELREICRSLPGAKGVRRGGRHAYWTIPSSPAAAVAALEALGPFGVLASPGVQQLAAEAAMAASARARFVDGGHIPEADGTDVVSMSLWDHQRVAVGYAEEASALLLAIPMSGGKTAIAIAAVNRRQAARVLIVCPNKVRRVWPREVRERSRIGWHIEDGSRPARRGGGRVDLPVAERLERAQRVLYDCDCDAPTHAFVINYEALAHQSWRDHRWPHPLDAIVYDEIHRLKSPTGQSSKTAGRWVSSSRFRLGLSGTPVPQNWWDIFGVFRALDPGIFGDVWTPFKNAWAIMKTTREGRNYPDPEQSRNDDELARRFHSITYRPIVDLDLPPVSDRVWELELEPTARRTYDELATDLWSDLSRFLREQEEQAAGGGGQTSRDTQGSCVAPPVDLDAAIPMWMPSPEDIDAEGGESAEVAGDAPLEITANNILTRVLRLQQLTGGWLKSDDLKDEDGETIARGQMVRVSHTKQEALAEVLDEIGCTGAAARRGAAEPVVVFCRFRTDLDSVKELAEKEGLRYGEISGRRGDGLDADSRMNPAIDICAVQIQSGGTGVDLTRARFGIWYSLGYSVADYDQARSRLVRINQSRPVSFIHLIVAGTADQDVYDAIDDRRSALGHILRQQGFDPGRLGVHEAPVGSRVDTVDGVTQSAHVTLPWEG